MKNFAYMFAIGSKIVWSSEDHESLLKRPTESDLESVKEFIDRAMAGDFLGLSTGEVIVCIKVEPLFQ